MKPELISSQNLVQGDIGQFTWDTTLNTDDLEYSSDGSCATWKQAHMEPGQVAPRIWVPVQSQARLHSGDFRWDFKIEKIGDGQIGIGFMLDWTIGPDWGFYGYLGSSSSAWAYDPTSGDVVIDTRSIEGGLPIFSQGQGVVTVEAHLPREGSGSVRFVVDGKNSLAIDLPVGSVLVPAACFLAVGQRVSLQSLQQEALDISGWRRPKAVSATVTSSGPEAGEEPASKPGLLSRLKKKLFGH
jgi:hypothetical protein